MESWTDFIEDDVNVFTVIMNRYLPRWHWDRFENYENDYRWSPASPPVEIKGFRRYYNVTSLNLSKIDTHWIDLGTFEL